MMSVSYSSRRERSISNPRRQSGDSDPPPYPPLSVPEGRALSLPAPWARPATEVEQTPDGSLGTHKPPSHLSVPEGRSLFKDNKDNKNNMTDSMLS